MDKAGNRRTPRSCLLNLPGVEPSKKLQSITPENFQIVHKEFLCELRSLSIISSSTVIDLCVEALARME
jgi:hypothetical protein